jgi:hypothetical protein
MGKQPAPVGVEEKCGRTVRKFADRLAADQVEIAIEIGVTFDVVADIGGRTIVAAESHVHRLHVGFVYVVHTGRSLRPGSKRPVDDGLDDDPGDAHEIRILAHAVGVHDGIGQQNDSFRRPRQFEAAPLRAEHDRVALGIGERHVDRRQVGTQRRESADLLPRKGIGDRRYLVWIGVDIGLESAPILQVRADIDRRRNERPVQCPTQQTQRHRQIGEVLKDQSALLDGPPQAVGKAEALQPAETTFCLGHRACRCQQVELLGVGVKDGVQISALLAQQFTPEDDGIRTDRQGRTAGVLHAVPGVAANCLGKSNQFVGGHSSISSVGTHKSRRHCGSAGAFSQQVGQVAAQRGDALAKRGEAAQATVGIEQEDAGRMVHGIARTSRRPFLRHQLQLADQSRRRLGAAAQPEDGAPAGGAESGHIFLEHRQAVAIGVDLWQRAPGLAGAVSVAGPRRRPSVRSASSDRRRGTAYSRPTEPPPGRGNPPGVARVHRWPPARIPGTAADCQREERRAAPCPGERPGYRGQRSGGRTETLRTSPAQRNRRGRVARLDRACPCTGKRNCRRPRRKAKDGVATARRRLAKSATVVARPSGSMIGAERERSRRTVRKRPSISFSVRRSR